jgi:hypothetical protein
MKYKRRLYYKIGLIADGDERLWGAGDELQFHTGWSLKDVQDMRSCNMSIKLVTPENRALAIELHERWMRDVSEFRMLCADYMSDEVIRNEKTVNPDIAYSKSLEEDALSEQE